MTGIPAFVPGAAVRQIAHDLRNLLMALGLNLETFAEHGATKPAGAATLQTMRQTVGEAQHLVDRLGRLAAADAPAAASPAASSAATRGAQETVLVVDDAPRGRDAAGRLLRGLGYRTLVAGSAGEALAVLRSDAAVDLLLADLRSSGDRGGPDLAAAARRLRPGLAVLDPAAGDASATTGGAARPSLDRPDDRAALAARVRAALDRATARG